MEYFDEDTVIDLRNENDMLQKRIRILENKIELLQNKIVRMEEIALRLMNNEDFGDFLIAMEEEVQNA